MNSLSQSTRSVPPLALSRSAARSTTFGRSSAYRRLPSSDARSVASSSPSSRAQLPHLRPVALRSSFLPHEIRPLLSHPAQTRPFHLTSSRCQQTQEKAETKAKTSDESSETKEESTSEEKQQQKKENEGGAGEEKAEGQEGEKKGEKGKKDMPPPPPHGDKTPWQVFMETMQTEFQASKEWNESTKALSGEIQTLQESERVRKARQAYESTTGAISSTTSTVVKTTAGAIGKSAAWTWDTAPVKGVRKVANVTGDVLDKATKPIRETEAYKNVKEVIDDGSSSRYGGWLEKEERRKKREAELQKNPAQTFEEDPDAGTHVTLHKDAAWKEAWRDFRDQNKFVQGFFSAGRVYQESENPLISTARSITDTIGGLFAENEQAQVIKKIRTMDPNFKLEPFLTELREFILPEVLDAYVKGDVETLKLWLSEAQYSVYDALTKQYLKAGMKSDGRILDIRHVDIARARILDPGDIPVFVITCRTQEVHVYRNAKTNELAAGMEDKVQQVTYAIGITRVPEDVSNPETRGWRLIEMQKSGRDYY
ncbi:TIM44 subunit of mitochondria import inner membrane translocase [Sodiomyces alkalinus F11]|uniref:Mitochondrial import inner membrane translocase subunit TIM44 n=1 Tax=Sodiomyces alkalinus (strain CBS 110278 / VKM F-3762 / F11) TaxID=1314773 RepID=A0A3N2Q315_SODAK|nr:TIM44 subunit of mitochondria import inner membrane translocase [Sodiomyces alkalinus F11]ROT41159.1 TIM44 subunit of mitochondria import inner membrane translocase [Sodiomyces alkalinus F11]